MKYAWFQEHQDSYPVQTMCCLLGVSRSGFYKWLDATPSPRAIRSETIKATVRMVFESQESRLVNLSVVLGFNSSDLIAENLSVRVHLFCSAAVKQKVSEQRVHLNAASTYQCRGQTE